MKVSQILGGFFLDQRGKAWGKDKGGRMTMEDHGKEKGGSGKKREEDSKKEGRRTMGKRKEDFRKETSLKASVPAVSICAG